MMFHHRHSVALLDDLPNKNKSLAYWYEIYGCLFDIDNNMMVDRWDF